MLPRSFWINAKTGEILPAPDEHAEMVRNNPEKFGLDQEHIQQIEQAHWGYSMETWGALIEAAAQNGWVRVTSTVYRDWPSDPPEPGIALQGATDRDLARALRHILKKQSFDLALIDTALDGFNMNSWSKLRGNRLEYFVKTGKYPGRAMRESAKYNKEGRSMFKKYLREQELRSSKPSKGDIFRFEINEELMMECPVEEAEQMEDIMLAPDQRMYRILDGLNMFQSTNEDEYSDEEWDQDDEAVKKSNDPAFVSKMIKKWGDRGSKWLGHRTMVKDAAPPGREKQVKTLKKKFAQDDDPKTDDSTAYAVAWKQHNEDEINELSSLAGLAQKMGSSGISKKSRKKLETKVSEESIEREGKVLVRDPITNENRELKLQGQIQRSDSRRYGFAYKMTCEATDNSRYWTYRTWTDIPVQHIRKDIKGKK